MGCMTDTSKMDTKNNMPKRSTEKVLNKKGVGKSDTVKIISPKTVIQPKAVCMKNAIAQKPAPIKTAPAKNTSDG